MVSSRTQKKRTKIEMNTKKNYFRLCGSFFLRISLVFAMSISKVSTSTAALSKNSNFNKKTPPNPSLVSCPHLFYMFHTQYFFSRYSFLFILSYYFVTVRVTFLRGFFSYFFSLVVPSAISNEIYCIGIFIFSISRRFFFCMWIAHKNHPQQKPAWKMLNCCESYVYILVEGKFLFC